MSATNTETLTNPNQIKNAITKLVDNIVADENKAHAIFEAEAELKDGLSVKIKSREFEYHSDEPAILGGNNTAPTPVELLLGSLCACQEIVVKAYATTLGIKLHKVSVVAKGEIDLRGLLNINKDIRPGFHTVHFNTEIDTTETNTEKLDLLLKLAEEQCPVLDIIQNPVKVNGSIAFSNSNN
tara:strand:- start:19304 stop:19852 length:549 start_codon:yes stop_codon:yes gene_type:complete